MSETNHKSRADHDEAAVLLDRLFAGEQTAAGLGGERVLEIQRHAAECEACRRRFDRLALADRALLGLDDTDEPGDFEREFRDASVVSAIDELLAEEQGADASVEGADVVPMPQRSGWQRLAMPLSAAAALVLIIAGGIFASDGLDPLGSDAAHDGDFQPRSVAQPDDRRAYQKPQIELFCARESAGDVQFQGSSDAPFGLLGCPNHSRLKFAYASPDPELRHVAFFGVNPAGAIYWYGPSPTRSEPWAISPREKMGPVGDTIELEVNHEPGTVRVYALFTPEPMRYSQLASLLERKDKPSLFEMSSFSREDFDGAWATETFKVVAEEGE
jgi:hypothetical protein